MSLSIFEKSVIGLFAVSVIAVAVSWANNHGNSLIDEAQAAVKSRLKDPESVRFQDGFVIGTGNERTFCGKVNARNGFGGYSGHVHFRYVELIKSVQIDQDPYESGKYSAYRLCNEEKSKQIQVTIALLGAAKLAAEKENKPLYPSYYELQDWVQKQQLLLASW
jgi:hypothetical protein